MTSKYRKHEIVTLILLIMLILSFIYGIVGLILHGRAKVLIYNRPQIDLIKITLMCLLGIATLFLPCALEHKFKISFPGAMHILFVLFLYFSIILGSVHGYYLKYVHWDTVLHTFSGIMLSAFGFCVVDIINRDEKINLGLPDSFMSFFAFCFATTLGALWEIAEFTLDGFFDMNSQQYIDLNGVAFVGRYALIDTMKDLIVDVLGALAVSLVGYMLLKKRRKQ